MISFLHILLPKPCHTCHMLLPLLSLSQRILPPSFYQPNNICWRSSLRSLIQAPPNYAITKWHLPSHRHWRKVQLVFFLKEAAFKRTSGNYSGVAKVWYKDGQGKWTLKNLLANATLCNPAACFPGHTHTHTHCWPLTDRRNIVATRKCSEAIQISHVQYRISPSPGA